MSDQLTVLRSRGRRLAKFITAEGTIIGYDSARTFDAEEITVASIDDLAGRLRWLAREPERCIVRGALAEPNFRTGIRRLVHPDPKTGEVPTLREVPRHWLALDFDALDRPQDIDATDITACGRIALRTLPTGFQDAACIVQATGSHGVTPGLRLRLWFWLDRPLLRRELDYWLRGVSGLDRSIFRPAQVIYTGAPIFADGRGDHLPHRIVTLPGAAGVVTPSPASLTPPPPRPPRSLPGAADANAARYAFAALRNAAARVAAAGNGDRHPTVLREAGALARFVRAGLLTAAVVKQALEDAAQQVGKPEGEAASVVDWALDHLGGA